MKTRYLSIRLPALLLCLVCGVGSAWVGAAEVGGLYEATVPVASRDNERERVQAFALAMRQMLVRLTGRTDTIAHPQIARAIATPQSYVETWLYRSVGSVPGQPEIVQLQVTFFQPGIQRLLNDANIAVWPQTRPETLLWVVVQDELGAREFAGSGGVGTDILAELQRQGVVRGLPLAQPVLDFEDRIALRPEQVWNFDPEALRRASARYGIESILALRVFRLLNGDVIGKATYLFREQMLEFEVLEGQLPDFLAGSIDLAATELAGYYAVLLSGIDSSTELLLTVEGIDSVTDYAALLQYLGSLAAVNNVQIASVENSTVELQLRTGGQFRQLIESIALDRRMGAQGEVARENNRVFMRYQWLGR